jgi:hypothetical protein
VIGLEKKGIREHAFVEEGERRAMEKILTIHPKGRKGTYRSESKVVKSWF